MFHYIWLLFDSINQTYTSIRDTLINDGIQMIVLKFVKNMHWKDRIRVISVKGLKRQEIKVNTTSTMLPIVMIGWLLLKPFSFDSRYLI
jgi:hypothetical protein